MSGRGKRSLGASHKLPFRYALAFIGRLALTVPEPASPLLRPGQFGQIRDRLADFISTKYSPAEQICCSGTKCSALSPMRVLIADDEKAFSTVLADLVRSCGHEVVDVVHSGLDAIRSYRRCKPDVVLMDFAMARLNGLTACRNILSEDPQGCILFLSGLSERNELIPKTSGALAVLPKPISRDRLEQILADTAMRRQKVVQIPRESVG